MTENSSQANTQPRRGAIRWLVRETSGNIILVLLILGISGHWGWLMGWALSAIYIIWSAATAYFILPINPDLLAERSRPKQGAYQWDLILVSIFGVLNLAEYTVAALDLRFAWSQSFPVWLQVLGLLVAFAGYDLLLVWSMVSNAFFVAIGRIQKERGHSVATGGPYAFVRHPGYLGTILFHLATPFMLNSAWALIPSVASVILLIVRTYLEDRALQADLQGYKQYTQQVRYRLLPGIW